MDREQKQESAIATAARVSIVTLAELDKYWDKEGYKVRTMSQLINWSLERLAEIVKSNGLEVGVNSVAEAHQYLASRRLYQTGMLRRGAPKIESALKFESLREEGVDPKDYVSEQYKIRHNNRSVQAAPKGFENNMQRTNWLPVPGYPDVYYPEGDAEQLKKILEQLKASGRKSDREVLDEELEAAIENAKKTGLVKASANMSEFEREKIERESLKNLNAPLDTEFIKKYTV